MELARLGGDSNTHSDVTHSKPAYKFEVIDLQHGYITQGVYWVAELVQDFFNNVLQLLNISYQFSFASNNITVDFDLQCRININDNLFFRDGEFEWSSGPNFNRAHMFNDIPYDQLIEKSPQDFRLRELAFEGLGEPEKRRIFKFAHRPPNISYTTNKSNKIVSLKIAEQDDFERKKLVDAKQVKLVDVETKADSFILRFNRNPVVIANNIVVCDNFKLVIPMQAPPLDPSRATQGPETIPVECSRSYSVPRSLGKPKVSIIQSE